MQYAAVSALTHEGLVRDHNEDSMVVGPWTTCASVTQTPQTLYFPLADRLVVAVADGLGGHPAGEVASAMVAQELAGCFGTLTDEDEVRAALDRGNRRLFEAARRDPATAGMGSTVAGLVLSADSVVVFNIGDSRVYALDAGGLHRLSVDDNPPLAPGETHTSVLTQTMGGYAPADAAVPHLSTLAHREGRAYLVCSDGLTDVVGDDAITAILRRHRRTEAVYELWRAAIEGGGPDNITVATVELADASG